MVTIPFDALSIDALRGVIESFVLREGTDYGPAEFSLDDKCAAVLDQLRAGTAEIWFDAATGTVDIRPV